MPQKNIFSGVQPTGNLHLGNYIGAIKNFVKLQSENDSKCIYCVVDLHAITTKQDPQKLKDNILETTAVFLASGIDPSKSIIFNQSMVPAHSEGTWILSCIARMGWLNRMTQFKEKAGKDKEKASVGLYIYPILIYLFLALIFGIYLMIKSYGLYSNKIKPISYFVFSNTYLAVIFLSMIADILFTIRNT